MLASLDDDSREQVVATIELLEDRCRQLGRPIVDRVTASRHRTVKGLRPGSFGRSELRVPFAVDPGRSAIMLIAGDEAGNRIRWQRGQKRLDEKTPAGFHPPLVAPEQEAVRRTPPNSQAGWPRTPFRASIPVMVRSARSRTTPVKSI